MEVGEVASRMSAGRVVLVTDVTRLGGSTDTRLPTIEFRLVTSAARVGRVDGHVERGVDKWRVAALSPPCSVVARP